MARDIHIDGECLVYVKGNVNTAISSLTELGLSDTRITVSPTFKDDDIIVDAWGETGPTDEQVFPKEVMVSMSLVHVDRAVLDVCMQEASAGASGPGTVVRAGIRMGGGGIRFAAGNHWIGLNIAAPVSGKPWRFYYAKIVDRVEIPMGTKRSIFGLTWRAIAYTPDPWNAGAGAEGAVIYDHTLDS